MANFTFNIANAIKLGAAYIGAAAHIPVTWARFIATGLNVGGENDLESVLVDFAAHLDDHTNEGSIRADIATAVDYSRWTGAFDSTRVYTTDQEMKGGDGNYYRALQNVAAGGADPTATTANWEQLAGLDLLMARMHEYLFDNRSKVYSTDWGNLPVNTLFRVGDIVPRLGKWFITDVANRKGAVGPDDDATNFSALTNYAGVYDDAAYYHAGIFAEYRGKLAFSLQDIVPADPVPDHDDNVKWYYPPNAINDIFRPWKYVEPSSGLADLEIDATDAAAGEVENITLDVDDDRILVNAVRAAQAAGIKTELHISGTVKYFLKQDPPLSDSSGAILTVGLWLGADPRADASRFLQQLDRNVLTLADYRNSNGGRSAYGSTADVEKDFRFILNQDDFATWDLQRHETLSFVLYGNNINGLASVKAEISDVEITYDRLIEELVAGEGIAITTNDSDETITITNTKPAQDPLRYRAVVSSDVRTTTEKYQIEYGGTSYTVQHSASRINTFTPAHPNLPDDFEATKVNLFYDGGDHQFNPSGVDFTAESAGSTTRTIKCTLEIAPDPSQERSNNDILNLGIVHFGRARTSVTSKRLAFANHQDYPFKIHFDLTYTDTPRGGLADAIAFTLQADVSRIKVIPKLTYYLPFTGATLPTQKYDQPGTNGHVLRSTLSLQERAQIIPEGLDLVGGRMALWEIPSGSPNNEGRNDPTEEDHSDSVRAPLGSHGNVFIEATQDLSQLHLTLKQKAQVATSHSYEIYLITYLRGVLKPEVIAHTSLFSGPPQWTMDYLGKGILKGQRFYVMAKGGVIGDAEMIWDATIQDAVRTVTVKPGFTTSREIVLGSAANTFTLGNIVNLPPVETWVKLRFFSSGLITTLDWPENYLEGFPTSAGQPSATHQAIGPLSAHETDSTGTIVHNRYIVLWQDSPDWKFSVYSGSSLNSIYLDRVELEYELLN